MITALYASIMAVIIIWLAFEVIKQRRKHQISYADGGVEALQIARSAQSNAVEYIPITLILMALVEYNGAPAIWIHILGVLFVIGRLLHAKAILKQGFKGRVLGMQLTLFVMAALIVSNLIYLPFDKLW